MTILVESTETILVVDRVPCRVWAGHTETGTPVYALVAILAVGSDVLSDDLAEAMTPGGHANRRIEDVT